MPFPENMNFNKTHHTILMLNRLILKIVIEVQEIHEHSQGLLVLLVVLDIAYNLTNLPKSQIMFHKNTLPRD